MAHAWKACWVQALGGSNPPSSATGPRDRFRFRGFLEPGALARGASRGLRVIGHYVLVLWRLFGLLVRESRYFSWLGPTMRMDRSCCWKGDFSACGRGKSLLKMIISSCGGMNAPTCPMCGRTLGQVWTFSVKGTVRRGVPAACVPRRAGGPADSHLNPLMRTWALSCAR